MIPQSRHFSPSRNLYSAKQLARGTAVAILLALASCGDSHPDSAAKPSAPEQSTAANTQVPTTTGSLGELNLSPAPASFTSRPPVEVSPSALDWGIVAPNASAKISVTLKNTSDKPLKILSVQPSCKCTTTDDLNGSIIAPGESVDLNATFDAQPNPGPRTTAVKVLFEGYADVLTIAGRAEVARPVRVRPPYINAVDNQNAAGSLLVTSIDGKPFRILSVQNEAPPHSRPSDAGKSKTSFVLEYDIANYLQPDGRYPRFIVIETDREDAPLVEIMLRHENSMPNINRYLKVHDYKANLGRVAPGGTITHKIGVRESTTPGPLVAVIGDERIIRAEILDQVVDEETDDLFATIEFTIAADAAEGVHYFPITIYASRQAELTIPAFVSVRKDVSSSADDTADSEE